MKYQFPESEAIIDILDNGAKIPWGETFIAGSFLDLVRAWNLKAFGPGTRTEGTLDHIRKELNEIEADPNDPEEWVDVVLLALNGLMRLDYTGDQILDLIDAKIRKNVERTWPDWEKADPNKAIEHVKGLNIDQWVNKTLNDAATAKASTGMTPLRKDLEEIVETIDKQRMDRKVKSVARQIFDMDEQESSKHIHSNRFPAWHELTEEQKESYSERARKQLGFN